MRTVSLKSAHLESDVEDGVRGGNGAILEPVLHRIPEPEPVTVSNDSLDASFDETSFTFTKPGAAPGASFH